MEQSKRSIPVAAGPYAVLLYAQCGGVVRLHFCFLNLPTTSPITSQLNLSPLLINSPICGNQLSYHYQNIRELRYQARQAAAAHHGRARHSS
jgi:hypothetical protein